jgi:nucleotide-binding universal stress UspA family protein
MLGVAPLADTGLKSVLIATDFSKASAKPLRHGLAIARHYGAKFYLTHVLSSLGYTLAGPQALELASEAAAREMQQLEHDLIDNGSLAGLDHEFIVRQGPVWEELQTVIAANFSWGRLRNKFSVTPIVLS